MAFNTQGALGGGMQGASAGAAFGPWGAAIGGGIGLLAGGLMGKDDSAQKAAAMQEQMIREAMAQQSLAQEKAAGLYQPWLNQGMQAQQTLAALMQPGGALYGAPDMSHWRSDPAWQNIKNQALDSIRRSGTYSGQTALDLEQKAEQLADQQFGQIYARKAGEQQTLAGRLGAMASEGATATQNLASLYTGTAGAQAPLLAQIGGIRAAGEMGAGDVRTQQQNAIWQGLAGIGQAYQGYQQNQTLKDLIAKLNA